MIAPRIGPDKRTDGKSLVFGGVPRERAPHPGASRLRSLSAVLQRSGGRQTAEQHGRQGALVGAPCLEVSDKPTFRETDDCVLCDHHMVEDPNVDQCECLFQGAC